MSERLDSLRESRGFALSSTAHEVLIADRRSLVRELGALLTRQEQVFQGLLLAVLQQQFCEQHVRVGMRVLTRDQLSQRVDRVFLSLHAQEQAGLRPEVFGGERAAVVLLVLREFPASLTDLVMTPAPVREILCAPDVVAVIDRRLCR